MAEAYLCAQCGVQYAPSEAPPASCAICADERQFVNPAGQSWLTLDQLRATHENVTRLLEPNLTSIRTEPGFAMGQQALLVQSPAGNVLWDCVSLIDDRTAEAVAALGGLSAIAISHPHFYDAMVEWSRAFGDVPVYLHEADRAWVMRPDPCIVYWESETLALNDAMTLIRCGGHFAGSAVLHWANGAASRGVLLTGDTIHPAADPGRVSFMRSFPNMMPLDGPAVRAIDRAAAPYAFDRLYGIYLDRVIGTDAKAVVRRSVERYLHAIGATGATGAT